RAAKKSARLRGKSILRGGAGAASRCVGVIGSMLTYAISAGVIERNVAHGIRKPKDQVRDRRLSVDEYRILGDMLRRAGANDKYTITVGIIRQLALTGCRRSEIISLRWDDVDTENSCLRLSEPKEGASTRPIGLPAVEFLEEHRLMRTGTFVFPGSAEDNAFDSFQNHWANIFAASPLADVTAHILRHSFASVANDLGFTESTIAALIGHSTASVTSKYIHTLDTALLMAADTISGYIKGLLDGVAFKQTAYALDRDSRKAALAHFLLKAACEDHARADAKEPLVA
ncbi:site-specific integrase, partial [Tabrizicola sp.]|uniref:tyrosine-type recombinase/integrase n=1 Tax=Tabrizicola sp. TaxID=2005166 RepID=UPI00286D0CC1